MSANAYRDGRRVEYAVMEALTDAGYACTRAASSKGAADVIGIGHQQIVLVNVKRTTPPGPSERAQLLRIAGLIPDIIVPLVALKPRREPLSFRVLTGPGASDWTPWEPQPMVKSEPQPQSVVKSEPHAARPLAVYPRDATFLSDGRGGSAYALHWPTTDGTVMARCQPRFTMLDCKSPRDPADVPVPSRCGRPGCREAWRRWEKDPDTPGADITIEAIT